MKLTRAQAIELLGPMWVYGVESLNCEPTNRVYPHEDGEIEWAASVEIASYEGLTDKQIERLPVGGCTLWAIYYTSPEDAAAVEENGGDWSAADWTVDHFELF